MSFVIRLSAVCAVVVAIASTTNAQVPYNSPGGILSSNPAYSPYLNLLRPGNSAGANYYGLVKPELDFRSGFRGLQQQVGLTQLSLAQSTDAKGLPVTGHTAVFLNTGGYFLNSSGGGFQKSGTAGKAGGAAGSGQAPKK